MREALSGLTVRGRAFLAAGVTAVVCATLLGQSSLSRVGVLLVALPLVTALVIGRTRYRLSLVRDVRPQQVAAGEPALVELTLTNQGRTPSGVLMLEDQLPYTLGTRPRFVLEGIGHGWSRHASYRVRSDVRGRFEIGPMAVRVTDPFGLVELGRAFRTTVPFVVTPRTVPLAPIVLEAGYHGSGEHRSRAFTHGSAEDVTVREYRRGDDLRRVHWRSSARTGELMVRREEQPWQSRATIFLDNRVLAHRGSGPASSFETAVSAAASVGVHLSARGYAVRLVTAAGEDPATSWQHRRPATDTRAFLESLAVIPLLASTRLDTGWVSAQPLGGVTLALVGHLQPVDAPLLRRMKAHTGLGLAMCLDVAAWVGDAGRPADRVGSAGPTMRSQGWRVTDLDPTSLLPVAWEELGRSGRSTTAATPGATPGTSGEARP